MAKYYVVKKFSIGVGPQFGFLLAARTNSFSYTDAYNSYGDSYSEDVKELI